MGPTDALSSWPIIAIFGTLWHVTMIGKLNKRRAHKLLHKTQLPNSNPTIQKEPKSTTTAT